MSQSTSSDGRLDYFEWASRLTHSEHEKAQNEFMSRGPRPEPRPDVDAVKEPPPDE